MDDASVFSKTLDELTREERYKFLVSIGCIVCRNVYGWRSDPCIHHIRSGQGMMRAPDHLTIPLCPRHHLHHGYGVSFHDGPKAWQEKFGSEIELLDQVNSIIERSIEDAKKEAKKASAD